jgi:hypothetical protein
MQSVFEGKSLRAIGVRLNLLACLNKNLRIVAGSENIDKMQVAMRDCTDLFAKNKNGESAVHISSRNSNFQALSLLAQSKADVMCLNKDGKSALELADDLMCSGMLKVIGSDGWNPVMFATERGFDRFGKYLKYREAAQCMMSRSPFANSFIEDFTYKVRTSACHWTWGPCDESSVLIKGNGLKAIKCNDSPDFSCVLGSCAFQSGIQRWTVCVGNVQSMWLGIARSVDLNRGLCTSPELCECEYLLAFGSDESEAVIIANGKRPLFEAGNKLSFSSGQIVEFELNLFVHTLQIKVDGIVKILAQDIDGVNVQPYVCMDYEDESVDLLFASETIPPNLCHFEHLSWNERAFAFENKYWSPHTDSVLSLFPARTQIVHDFKEEEMSELKLYLSKSNIMTDEQITIGAIATRWNVLRAVETLGIESICGALNSVGSAMQYEAGNENSTLYCKGVSGQEDDDATGFEIGDEVEGQYKNGNWYTARIASKNPNGTFVLNWDDGDTQDRVKPSHQIRLRNSQKQKVQVICSSEGEQCGVCRFSQMYPERTLANVKNFEFYRNIWGLTADSVHRAIIAGDDVNARNRSGQTPLHLAAMKGCDVSLIELLKANADPSAVDKLKQSALKVAANSNCVRLLKMAGTDGFTALMMAAEKGMESIERYFKIRDVILSIHRQIPLPSWFEAVYRDSLRSSHMKWTWGSAEKLNMVFRNDKLCVQRIGDTREFSGAVGSCTFDVGIHRWSMRVENVQNIWIGISRGIEDSVEGLESAPGNFGDYFIAFCSDGSDPIILGKQPKFQRIRKEFPDSGSDENDSQHRDEASEKSGSENEEPYDDDDENNGEHSSDEEEQEEDRTENDDDVPAYGINLKSGYIVSLELNMTEHTLKVWINDSLRAFLTEIDDEGVRPYVCLGGSESVTLLQVIDVDPDCEGAEGSIIASVEDFSHGFDNTKWNPGIDDFLCCLPRALSGM